MHDEDGRRGEAISSLVSGGCIVSGATLRRSLLFTGVRINSYSRVQGGVILPYVEDRAACAPQQRGDRSRRENSRSFGGGEDPELDAKRFRRSDKGICLITQTMIDKLG